MDGEERFVAEWHMYIAELSSGKVVCIVLGMVKAIVLV